MTKQKGFTLIELMIALALGLVITASAILLFFTGQKGYFLQRGMADVQDNANFGLNQITKDIRLANLNVDQAVINDRTSYGGVVLTSSINADKDNSTPAIPLSNLFRTITGNSANENLLSRSALHDSNVECALDSEGCDLGDDLMSDQLVIQYRPQYIKVDGEWFGGFDCEGNPIQFAITLPKRIIVQRYFLRTDTNASADEPNQTLALACDAGWYAEPHVNASGTRVNPTAVTGFGGGGEIIMKRVDHFRVLLGIENNGRYQYVPVDEYMALAAPKPRILSLQIGALVRSAQTVGRDNLIRDDQQFRVLDQTVSVTVPTNTNARYVRQVVSQTVALRNTFGGRGQ
ncbi:MULTISPECIES: PilW family protein [Acinetobacter]|uniref:PilW family protein n=1 Tax=Acinetobacter TaxID=469 RepID=UPI00158DBB6B|nr:PilW family protein [Acinetobacter sp. FDAARGOS_724]QKW81290.1 PilW family protein [Acinetobacter sp. FDAARGOS_724]